MTSNARTSGARTSSGKRRGRGEGSISLRQDGRWEAAVTLPGTPPTRKRFYARTRAEVARKLTQALRDRDQGFPLLRDERQTLGDYLAGWLLTRQPPQLEPKTYRRYQELITLHLLPTLGRVPLTKLTPQHVQQCEAEALAAGLSSTTVRKLHMVLHAALHAALRLGLVQRNVSELVDTPRNAKTDIRPLSAEQVRVLLDAAVGDRYEALYVLAVTTGMRQGELLGLHWRDVDLGGADLDTDQDVDGASDDVSASLSVRTILQRTPAGLVFKQPKTPKSRRRIGLGRTTVEALRTHRARQAEERLRLGRAWAVGWPEHADLVFPSRVGTPLEGEHLSQRQFKPLLRRAGLPAAVRFHDLRHTAATLALGQNINPKVVSEMLGHASIAITLDTYTHFLPHLQATIADALDTVVRRPVAPHAVKHAVNGAERSLTDD